MNRAQSEDYCRPENVVVYRDHGYGYKVTRMIDEPARVGAKPIEVDMMAGHFVMRAATAPSWHEPSPEMVRLAAEMLLAQAGKSLIVSVDELRDLIVENRGIKFSKQAVARVASATLEPSRVQPGAYWLSKRSLL